MDGFNGHVIHTTEPLKGWRAWKIGYIFVEEDAAISYTHPRLVSVAIEPNTIENTSWQPMVKAASEHLNEMKGPDHIAPMHDCVCGFWSFKEREELLKEFGSQKAYVFGQITAWGKVVEGHRGYRSQYAYPDTLYLNDFLAGIWNLQLNNGNPEGTRDIVKELRDTYKVETHTFTGNSF